MDQHVIKMVALGRRFQLGDLYNYRIDQILTEYRCGSADFPSGTQTETGFKLKLICPDSDITHKWQHMGLDGHLQASILAGLFETEAEVDKLRGASHYVNEKCNPNEVTRTIICRSMNRKEHLDLPNFLSNSLATEGKLQDATHIVVGIAYGAEAYCVLAQNVQDDKGDSREEIAELLAKVSSKMENTLEKKQGAIEFKKQFTNEEKKLVKKIKCRVYADHQSQTVQLYGLFNAYKLCLEFVNHVENIEKSVPVVAVLCPLGIVMKANEGLEKNFMYRDVNAGLVARCCRIWTELEQVISTSESLLLSFKKSSCFPALRQFTRAVSKFKDLLKNSWKKSIVKARESEDEDDREVEEVANFAETHPLFNFSRLNQWLRFKKAEMEMVEKLDKIGGITFLADKTQLGKVLAFSFDKKFTVVLNIPSLDQRTKDLLCVTKNYVGNSTMAGDDDSDGDVLPWHMVTDKKKQVLDKVLEMAAHVENNKHLAYEVQYFIIPKEGGKLFSCSYSIYQAANLLMENVDHLPTPPSELRFQLDTQRPNMPSIELKWDYEDLGYPCTFLIEYRLKDDPGKSWKQKTFKVGETWTTIHLSQNSVIEIRVAAETCIGRSGFSQVINTRSALAVSQPINVGKEFVDAVQQIREPFHVSAGLSLQSVSKTFPKIQRDGRGGKNKEIFLLPPTKLELNFVTQTTAELKWMPSPSCNASVAFFYIIRCSLWPKGQRLPVLIGVDSGETRFRLKNLQPGTTCLINIVAASENGQESAPSDTIRLTTLLTPIGVAQLYSTAFDNKLKLQRKMASNSTDDADETKSELFESGNHLNEKTKGSSECLTKSLHDGSNLTIACRPLLQGEAKIDMETKWFDTIESTNPNVKDIEDFIINGVSVNSEDNNGQTALHYLCRKKKSENLVNLVRLLVASGVNVSAKSYEGKTVLHLLCQYNEDNESLIDVARLLVENGVDINAKDNIGQTALQLLCLNNSNETLVVVIRLLVEKEVDVKAKDITGRTALHFLFQNDKSKNLIYIVRLLVANGVDVNAKDNYGWTALHFLCELNKNENLIDIVRYLIHYGVFVNATDNNGRTALHFLLKSYHQNNLVDIVRLLIENGIDVNKKNYEGKTALHLLCQYNENPILDYSNKGTRNSVCLSVVRRAKLRLFAPGVLFPGGEPPPAAF